MKVRRTVSRIRNVEEAQQQFREGKPYCRIGTPKTGSSVRDIPLPGFLTERLRRGSVSGGSALGDHRAHRKRAGDGAQKRSAEFKDLPPAVRLSPVSVHSLRHSFASKWIEQGLDSKALSEILGHSSVKITMDIYVHSTMNQKKNYMDHVLEGIVIDQRSSL